MRSTILKQWMNGIVVLTMLLSLSVLGFAHRVHAHHAAPLDVSTQAFLDAGGQLSDICEEGSEHSGLQPDCPVCTLAGGFNLPPSGVAEDFAPDTYQTLIVHADPSALATAKLDHSRSSRAPPLT